MRVLTIAVAMMIVFAGAGSAVIIPVPGPYGPTIQAAVNAANPAGGDVIQVAAGVYPEQVSVTKPLDLLGAGAATTTIDGTSFTGPGDVVNLSPPSGNITFDGFTVKAGAKLFTVRHSTPNAASVITISHNHLIGHNLASDDNYDFGVIGGYGSVGKVVVSSNTFDSYYNNPILFERHKGASEVVGNTIEIPDGADGIYYMTHSNDDVPALQSIRANVLTHQGSDRCGGIYVNSSSNYAGDRRGRFENVEILNNTVYGVGAQKRGIGMGNDCNIGDGSEGEIVSPRIKGNAVYGTGSTTNNRGLQLLGYITNADVSNNIFKNLQEGIRVWDYYSPGVFPVGTDIHHNSIAGCNLYGINWYGTATLDAEMNWWGDASGPGGVGPGTGSPVTANVDYDPWIGKSPDGNIVCVPDSEYLTATAPTKTIAVRYLGGGSGPLYGYTLKFTWDGSKVSTAANKVTQGDLLYTVPFSTFFFASLTGTNEITVDCARLGNQPGVMGPGTMFTIEFTGTNVGTSPIDITPLLFRDNTNTPLSGFYADDGLLIVDVEAPEVVSVHISNEEPDVTDDWVKNGDSVKLVATVTDDDPAFGVDNIWANLTGLDRGSAVHPDSYDWGTGAAVWNAWVADPTVPSDGTVTVTVYAEDDMGNTDSGADDITADNIAPLAVEDFDAAPAHEECVLSWTNGYDLNWEGVVVCRSGDGEYPTYPYLVANWPSVDAHYPADETAGTEVYDGAGTGTTDGVVPRDIYYYQAFCYDYAKNYGPAASTARDLSTNYWLGDVASGVGVWGYNGLVNDADIDKLGGKYHQAPPAGQWNECDVGPTVHEDYSRVGLPTPDNFIGFEDLMIFAMNYGVVAPRIVPFLPGAAEEALALSLAEVSRVGDEVQVAVRLSGNAGEVKGFSASVEFDATQLEFVSAALTPDMQSTLARVFFWAGCEDSAVKVDLAVLGTDVTIGGSGDAAVLTFRALSGDYALEFAEAMLRGADNEVLAADLDGCVSRPEVPTAFRLVQNAPNPFNPRTTVAYDVPVASEMSIRVYDVTGRLVTTLVDGVVEPGRHAVTWNGTNDAGEGVGTGVYFCVMDATDYHATRKMMLLR
jgi:hypothetical protein